MQCTGYPSTTKNYPAPEVSGAEIKKLWCRVEKHLEKRGANKPVCFLKLGISFCLSGCCLSREHQNLISGNQEFLMGLPSAGWSFHLPFLFFLLYKPSPVRELPEFHPKFSHSEFRSQDSAWSKFKLRQQKHVTSLKQRLPKASAMNLWNEALRTEALIEKIFCF